MNSTAIGNAPKTSRQPVVRVLHDVVLRARPLSQALRRSNKALMRAPSTSRPTSASALSNRKAGSGPLRHLHPSGPADTVPSASSVTAGVESLHSCHCPCPSAKDESACRSTLLLGKVPFPPEIGVTVQSANAEQAQGRSQTQPTRGLIIRLIFTSRECTTERLRTVPLKGQTPRKIMSCGATPDTSEAWQAATCAVPDRNVLFATLQSPRPRERHLVRPLHTECARQGG